MGKRKQLNLPCVLVCKPDSIHQSDKADAKSSGRERKKIRRAVDLQVSAPFHCRLMQPARDKLAQVNWHRFLSKAYTLLDNAYNHKYDNGNRHLIALMFVRQNLALLQIITLNW